LGVILWVCFLSIKSALLFISNTCYSYFVYIFNINLAIILNKLEVLCVWLLCFFFRDLNYWQGEEKVFLYLILILYLSFFNKMLVLFVYLYTLVFNYIFFYIGGTLYKISIFYAYFIIFYLSIVDRFVYIEYIFFFFVENYELCLYELDFITSLVEDYVDSFSLLGLAMYIMIYTAYVFIHLQDLITYWFFFYVFLTVMKLKVFLDELYIVKVCIYLVTGNFFYAFKLLIKSIITIYLSFLYYKNKFLFFKLFMYELSWLFNYFYYSISYQSFVFNLLNAVKMYGLSWLSNYPYYFISYQFFGFNLLNKVKLYYLSNVYTLLFYAYNKVEAFLIFIILGSSLLVFTGVTFRHKFLYFIVVIGSLIFWGLWASFDGIIIMSALIQLLAVVVFLSVFLTFKLYEIQNRSLFFLIYIFILGFFLLCICDSVVIVNNLFNLNDLLYFFNLDIVSNDLYLLFNYYFIQYTKIVVYIGTVIGLVSMFLCVIYFYFKFYKAVSLKKFRHTIILRRQQFIKQANYKLQYRFFQ
jgi:hypothetical protein